MNISITLDDTSEQVLQNRQKYNNMIIRTLKKYIRNNPTFKFVQILHVLGVITASGSWQEDSECTYKRIMRTLEQQKIMKERMYGISNTEAESGV